ncbi:MAG: 1-(5-phosphoribosyl)-5-[(5-phosphoribosylamino)methylideneamino]imidazole-4-carboxamide isomerase [Puniceicoccales bacterium]|jgi:phosphoribosylformimino-5-aminoimidazole carboxamide ribotide isomerase|nr:1-(5-phosphoribosyl)-5-[(5-phosphoribosylamino)methylideneamino]imidazole-4-carboxamide isomerase [Puniceicoccales bacterium]
MGKMYIIPAIDILNGEAVRLYKGDYAQKTVYSKNPSELAKKFKQMGAKFLHIVDLDGAKSGSPANYEIIKEIAKIIPIQVGGGIRTTETAAKYLGVAQRIILGTAAVKNPQFLREMVDEYGVDRIVAGIDVRDGKVSTNGWLEDSGINYLEFIDSLPAEIIIVTDISKDGTLTSPNWDMYAKIKNKKVIVSGGVSCEADLENDYYATIVGKAYYEGRIDLEKCLKKG